MTGSQIARAVLLFTLSVSLTPAYAGSLDGYLFDTRPILLFTSSPDNPQFKQQMRDLAAYECELYKRDLEVLQIVTGGEAVVDGMALSNEEVSYLKSELEVGSYSELIVLVGKDGKVKLRAHMPLKTADLLMLVDAMPMRKIEERLRRQETCHSA